jgi:chemotaxis protein methyltransferase CheR
VLIYFSDSSIERAAKNFYQMLVPGGHLLLGHSESFCRINTDFVPVRLEGVVVYQKQ